MDHMTGLAVEELVRKYEPHTIIVYGSRATNDAGPESDLDVACFADAVAVRKDARDFNGIYLDAWLYRTDEMNADDDEYLRFFDGYCALDTRGVGGEFLGRIRRRIEAGPGPLKEEDSNHLVQWVGKMLKRISRNDVEGNYRRNLLASELLEIYFKMRNRWYLGPKKSFSWLEQKDTDAYTLFRLVYEMPSDVHHLERLADYVLGKEREKAMKGGENAHTRR